MANLTDTNINGDLRVSGTVFGTQAGNYATCATTASTAAKVITISGFTLITGIHVFVKFTVTNTAAVASLTLNVSTTGAKAIKYRGGNLPAVGTLSASRVYEFVYDGTNWELVGDLDTFASLPLSIENGGTGATTAVNAANNLLSALPAWTANPTDDVKLIRRDTAGSATFGQVTFLTVWNYIKGKLTSVANVNISGNAATATKPTTTTLTSSDNLDSVGGSTTGDVLWYKWATGSVPTNVPATGTAVMEVVRTHSGNYITQTVYTTEHSVYRRECINGTWGAWYSYSKSTHTHGNITSGGALQTNDITIANGDKLVVTDASDSNKLARTSVAFDGTTTAKALTQKGTFESVMTPSEAMSLSGGDGVDVTIANNAATLSANISSIPTSVIEALS